MLAKAITTIPKRPTRRPSSHSPKPQLTQPPLRKNPEILTKRESMWEKVTSRSHKPGKIFPFPSTPSDTGDDEVMLHGTVDYVLKDGGKQVSVDWAARARLVGGEDGQLRMGFYQVYLVGSASFFF